MHAAPRCTHPAAELPADLAADTVPGPFAHQQCTLALDPPTVATQLSVLGHDAVTRNQHRYGIGAAGSGLRGLRGSECSQSINSARNPVMKASGWSSMRWWYESGTSITGALWPSSSYM